MKKFLICFLLTAAVIIPLACGNQNNIPVGVNTSAFTATKTATPVFTNTGTITPATSTFTPTITATPTNTPIGAFTSTPTATFSIPIPAFENVYGTTGAVNGMVIINTTMTLAEFQTSPSVGAVESFTISNLGVANAAFPGVGNSILQGFPVPNPAPTPSYNPLPAWTPSVTVLNGPQGFVNPTGTTPYSAILDSQPGGGAILYYGSSSTVGWSTYGLGAFYEPFNVSGYGFGSVPFKNPKGMAADAAGNIYIADTGNGYVEQFTGTTPLHYWAGNGGNLFANGFTSVVFKTPYAVGCDFGTPTVNVWVGDNGYTPAVVQQFSSGGTTITAGFQTVTGCVVHGITVSPSTGNIYVADSGNNQVEIYSGGPSPAVGTLLAVLKPLPGVYEPGAFAPSCIAFDNILPPNGPNLWVADSNNDVIMSFK